MIMSTGIMVNKPTATGRIYDENAVQNIIKSFNRGETNSLGGLLNRKAIESIGKITHRIKNVFLHDGELMVDVEVLDETIYEEIKNGNFVAKPILINELNQPTKIKGLRRIDIERCS